jgi:acetyl-CoA/propionyl-CoA carboxylase, biotin carboxylase, biotin carboxyl carrier protein
MSLIAGIDKVLIANRGEIAVRIARTLRRLGIRSVVAHHRIDAGTPGVRAADEAIELEGAEPIRAYLDGEQIAAKAREVGADALHPGYGFLSENAGFARAVEAAGVRFVGPTPEVMRLMGDKIESREFVRGHGFRVAPSATWEEDPATFLERARAVGFPLLIKASAGGGGKGMHVVRDERELAAAAPTAQSEAERYFGDGRIYAERYVERPRHIEVQVLGDRHGNLVHLFERECSIQRRFQKLVEESPAPNLSETLRTRICDEGAGIARAAGYLGAGTVEFVLGADGEFYFLEMNTRLQVEHPVTELVTGIDLVEEQLRIAAGEPLRFRQHDVRRLATAIECRICAEDAEADFVPATGDLLLVREPAGEGIRFDGGIAEGQAVTAAFDPMLAKLVAHAPTRGTAVERARRALRETVILGVTTNAAFLERVLAHPAFLRGELHTGFIPEHREALRAPPLTEETRGDALAAAALASRELVERITAVPEPWASIGRWRN